MQDHIELLVIRYRKVFINRWRTRW